MTGEAVFEEVRHFDLGPFGESAEYLERWMIDPPATGVSYTVLEDEWSEHGTIRTIKKIKLR